MFEIFGTELGLPARAVVALVLVLALIALTVWLMRRFGDGAVVSAAGGRGRQQRLAVLDSASVDARRRLVLIRRDNIEHLILIGGPTDVVIEPNIVRAQPATSGVRPSRPGLFDEDDTSLIPEPAPEPERPAPAAPAPAPAPAARPPAAPAAEAPRPAPRPAPAPQKLDPQYADMAQRLEAALRKPAPEPEVAARPAPAPRAPEPRILDQRAAAPRAPMPRIPEAARPAEAPRAPEAPRVPPPVSARPAPQPAASASADQAADVFASLEEEMASLLRPGAKK